MEQQITLQSLAKRVKRTELQVYALKRELETLTKWALGQDADSMDLLRIFERLGQIHTNFDS